MCSTMLVIPFMLHMWRIFLTYRGVYVHIGFLYVHPLHIVKTGFMTEKKKSISLEVEG